jgi:hypothetical protein
VEFFGIDNAEEIIKHLRTPIVHPGSFTTDAALAHGIFVAGFSTLEAKYEPDVWRLVLIDRLSRSELDAKSDLQSAMGPYLMFSNPTEFLVLVKSGTSIYSYGFIASNAAGRAPNSSR